MTHPAAILAIGMMGRTADPSEDNLLARARGWSRAVLEIWGLATDDELVDDALLVISELVTNALRHADGRIPPALALTNAATARGRFLQVEVHDDTPPNAALQRALTHAASDLDLTEECGRGLAIVRTLTGDRVRVLPRSSGKIVRADLEIPAQARDSVD